MDAGPGRRRERGPPAARSTRRTKPHPPTRDAPPLHICGTTIAMLWLAIARGLGRSKGCDFVPQPQPTGNLVTVPLVSLKVRRAPKTPSLHNKAPARCRKARQAGMAAN
ncbi:hypothetical protein Sme01_18290 [Sphaerisporangium melleum]|uniref:Uncharacterized protein n=1 Tax=Sphaerisporangium melleum TaxID=321316 RepID=A0A917RMW8_9ACTN|nr:hypothetical protein GCM10007964_65650 [Sphaerisporangium melleum]GII69353.1 hypothetical protein Sme01_18290 [Sphaerisporangium melleum]